jgi:hypothetical protein
MAHASKKKMGVGSQGKLAGTGAMTVLADGTLPENMVLSNRDKASHSGERGLDGRQMQTEQFHDHVGARRNFEVQDHLRSDLQYQERVRTRAYELWDQEGRPHGRDHVHWQMAEQEVSKIMRP